MLVANPIIRKIQAIKMHRSKDSSTGWRLELLPDFVQTSDEWFRPVAMTLAPTAASISWTGTTRSSAPTKSLGITPSATREPRENLARENCKKLTGSASRCQTHESSGEGDRWQTGQRLAGPEPSGLADAVGQRMEEATVAELKKVVLAAGQPQIKDTAGPAAHRVPSPYPDAARIQALWTLSGIQNGGDFPAEPIKSSNASVRGKR